jgi:hypothetical protein
MGLSDRVLTANDRHQAPCEEREMLAQGFSQALDDMSRQLAALAAKLSTL